MRHKNVTIIKFAVLGLNKAITAYRQVAKAAEKLEDGTGKVGKEAVQSATKIGLFGRTLGKLGAVLGSNTALAAGLGAALGVTLAGGLMSVINLASRAAVAIGRISFDTMKRGVTTVVQLGKALLTTTESFRKAEITLEGAIKSYAKVQQISNWAARYASRYPAQYLEVMQTMASLAQIPDIKPMIAGAREASMSRIMNIIQSLATIVPEQGTRGAVFAVREALAGNIRSLAMRFNISPTVLAGLAGMSFGEKAQLKTDPAKLLKALDIFVKLNVGEKALIETGSLLSISIENLKDKWKLFLSAIGKTGVYRRVQGLFLQLNEAAWALLDNPLFKQAGALFGSAMDLLTQKVSKFISQLGKINELNVTKLISHLHKLEPVLKSIEVLFIKTFIEIYKAVAKIFANLAMDVGKEIGKSLIMALAPGSREEQFKRYGLDKIQKWYAESKKTAAEFYGGYENIPEGFSKKLDEEMKRRVYKAYHKSPEEEVTQYVGKAISNTVNYLQKNYPDLYRMWATFGEQIQDAANKALKGMKIMPSAKELYTANVAELKDKLEKYNDEIERTKERLAAAPPEQQQGIRNTLVALEKLRNDLQTHLKFTIEVEGDKELFALDTKVNELQSKVAKRRAALGIAKGNQDIELVKYLQVEIDELNQKIKELENRAEAVRAAKVEAFKSTIIKEATENIIISGKQISVLTDKLAQLKSQLASTTSGKEAIGLMEQILKIQDALKGAVESNKELSKQWNYLNKITAKPQFTMKEMVSSLMPGKDWTIKVREYQEKMAKAQEQMYTNPEMARKFKTDARNALNDVINYFGETSTATVKLQNRLTRLSKVFQVIEQHGLKGLAKELVKGLRPVEASTERIKDLQTTLATFSAQLAGATTEAERAKYVNAIFKVEKMITAEKLKQMEYTFAEIEKARQRREIGFNLENLPRTTGTLLGIGTQFWNKFKGLKIETVASPNLLTGTIFKYASMQAAKTKEAFAWMFPNKEKFGTATMFGSPLWQEGILKRFATGAEEKNLPGLAAKYYEQLATAEMQMGRPASTMAAIEKFAALSAQAEKQKAEQQKTLSDLRDKATERNTILSQMLSVLNSTFGTSGVGNGPQFENPLPENERPISFTNEKAIALTSY